MEGLGAKRVLGERGTSKSWRLREAERDDGKRGGRRGFIGDGGDRHVRAA